MSPEQAWVPLPPVDIIFAELPSWYSCIPLSIRSLSFQPTGDPTTPAADGDYLSFAINGTAVRQELLAPLTPGTTYSIEANVIAPYVADHASGVCRG